MPARALLALAAAALVAAAGAQVPLQCSNAQIGAIGGQEIELPLMLFPPNYGKQFYFALEDMCLRDPQQGPLRAESVQACDDAAPLVQMSPNGLVVTVQRLGTELGEVKVLVRQYCY